MDFARTVDAVVGPFTVSVIEDDQYIGRALRHGNVWDGWMLQDLPSIYRPGTDLVDIGGNIGWNALMYSEFGPVHTFEPLFHPLITRNVERNVTKHPIVVHPYGLSDAHGSAEIYLPKRDGPWCNYGGTSLMQSHQHSDIKHNIQLERLDDVYGGQPSVLKIDVEGHEFEVIKGAEQTIRRWRPAMYVEIFGFDASPIPSFLKDLGYTWSPRPEHNYLFTWSHSHN